MENAPGPRKTRAIAIEIARKQAILDEKRSTYGPADAGADPFMPNSARSSFIMPSAAVGSEKRPEVVRACIIQFPVGPFCLFGTSKDLWLDQ